MKPGNHRACRTCSHFDPSAAAPLNLKTLSGNCHRFPPQVHLVPVSPTQLGVQSNFPPVTAEMWCSEWEGGIKIDTGSPLRVLENKPAT